MRCLVTGATGYIGARLVPELLAEGHDVRCLTRRASRLKAAPWAGRVDVVEGDLNRPESLPAAMAGIDVAYYLVHSLGQPDFEARDRAAATAFGAAARRAGVGRIIYLGGPQPAAGSGPASAHLRSRAEVARILSSSGVPTLVLRAAVIIGSGSASFEMLRYLTERLPVMTTPRWVRTRVQPIAVRDALHYLVASAGLPAGVSGGFDIGGPEVLSYAEMMHRYATVAGLRRRLILRVAVLSPRLSSLWVGLVTPVPAAVAKPLVLSLVHEAVVQPRHDIRRVLPEPAGGLTGFDAALRAALAQVRAVAVRPAATGAESDPARPLPSDPPWSGGSVYIDLRRRRVPVPATALWRVIEGLGGVRGWPGSPLAWSLRGRLDRLAGGPARGRRVWTPHRLRVGDKVDFWRVEEIRPGQLLRLRAELRMPGRAWLEMRVADQRDGSCTYVQRAVFLPRGLAGHAYWLAARSLHAPVFGAMARDIAGAAARLH